MNNQEWNGFENKIERYGFQNNPDGRTLALLKRAITRPVMPESPTTSPTHPQHPWRNGEAPQDPDACRKLRSHPPVPEDHPAPADITRRHLRTPAWHRPEALHSPRPCHCFVLLLNGCFVNSVLILKFKRFSFESGQRS